ncbi:hypothetical protein DM860_014222 [Cuscuta australis]|uniref:Bacterial surface antigen (D15) domain-containing protein n=1 Tax=Cuscuta australis TaxID=267555 RepID=A0A328DHU1_9ASTE|nr:hypothetical protein DM860_014222 [Cuscuta australis]
MAVEKLKDLAQSTQDFFASHILNWSPTSDRRRSPIEILKRLQREAFSDLMKLRERQEKAERVLSFYKTAKVGPFQEGGTRVKGEIDVLGALVMTNAVDQETCDAIQRTGIKSGVESRLWFETNIGERDRLVTEFVGGQRGSHEDVLGTPLSLAKVLYSANVSELLSAFAIPMGAQCRDFGVGTALPQEKALTDYSAIGPPLLNHLNGSAIGIVARKSNLVASLAQFASVIGSPPPPPPLPPLPTSPNTLCSFSTFAQVAYQLSTSTKLSLLGIRKGAKLSNQQTTRLGPMTFPIGIFARHERSSLEEEEEEQGGDVDGSMALMIESRLDESTRIGGWLEMKGKLQARNVKWAVTMADTPEDGLGWGLSLGGSVRDPRSPEHFQVEAFLNCNLGKRCRIQPAVLYMRDGAIQFPTLMLRSSFSL